MDLVPYRTSFFFPKVAEAASSNSSKKIAFGASVIGPLRQRIKCFLTTTAPTDAEAGDRAEMRYGDFYTVSVSCLIASCPAQTAFYLHADPDGDRFSLNSAREMQVQHVDRSTTVAR
jgi:hypothetical protein